MLESLMYISAANPKVGQRDLEDILHSSAHNNQREGLTGALVFSGSIFVQILEGQTEALDSLMTLLRTDRRHDAVTVVARELIGKRRFADWSMAYRRVDGLAAEQLHNQMGWDISIKRLLDDVPTNRPLKALSASIAGLIEQGQPQWASSQF